MQLLRRWVSCGMLVCLMAVAPSATCLASPTPKKEVAAPITKSALSVGPAILDMPVQPGKSTKTAIKVTNITAVPLPISGSIKNFIPLQKLDDTTLKSRYDASGWFTIDDPQFILQPKQTRTVNITIDPPNKAEPGGHYATIYFTPLVPTSDLTPSTAYLSAEVGTLAFLQIPGKIVEKLSIASFTTRTVTQTRDIAFQLVLKNTGNVHVTPGGYIQVRNSSGSLVDTLPLEVGIVLPGTHKTTTVDWKAPSPIGKYTATVHLTFGNASTKLPVQSVGFWIIPWAKILAMLLFAVTAVSIVIKGRGRWRKVWRILLDKEPV